MFRLRCSVQNYAWGKLGSQSEVAGLLSCSESDDFTFDDLQPFAELWMGTHPRGPCSIHGSGGKQLLSDYLQIHPEKIGDRLKRKIYKQNNADGVQLPFLFKVLSVNSSLSLQSHPSKEEAVRLHAEFPQHYPDDNHKPEMAIALTPFELMCGFRPPEEILQHIQSTPELFELVGGESFKKLQDVVEQKMPRDSLEAKVALRACFESLMRQPTPLLQKNVHSMLERIALGMNSKEKTDPDYIQGELLIRLNFNCPGDVGIFAPFFLNHFLLQPGESCYLGPNEPHAYLYGDCIECMACSDNTIRAGLSPKFKDVETLVQGLTYRMGGPEENKFPSVAHPVDPCVVVYDPPAPEFTVEKIQIGDPRSGQIFPLESCSILIVINGSANVLTGKDTEINNLDALSRGVVVFIPANLSVDIQISEVPFIAYRAYADANAVDGL